MAACGGGGSGSPAVVPLELEITPTDGAKIKLDGATILPEEQNGSDAENGNPPVSLGILTDNKNGNGEAVYKMATGDDAAADNDDFEITPNGELRYIGSDSGDFETTTKKNFAISIARYNNQADADDPNSNPQIVSVTINLQDQTEDLSIIPTENAPLTIENGELFLNEGIDGSGDGNAISLGKIDDAVDASGEVTYTLTTHTNLFSIRGDELFFIGSPLDYENAATAKQYTLSIVRNRGEVTEAPVERIINLKNLNDTAPEITGHVGETETEIGYIAASNVGNDSYEIGFRVAEGERITIKFENGGINFTGIEAITDSNDPSKAIEFKIIVGVAKHINLARLLNNDPTGNANLLRDSSPDWTIWNSYKPFVTYLGVKTADDDNIKGDDTLFTDDPSAILEAAKAIVVEEGATGIIADFSSTDKDGDTLTFLDLTGDDAALFNFDKDTGKLSFIDAPSYNTGTGADNIYDITVTVSDGTFTTTQALRIVVAKAGSPNVDVPATPTESSTAAESVLSAEESVAEATPEAEATKPSIGRRILDYLFGSQEEHRQMQNQQAENMFSDSDLDPITPQDPDML